MSRARLQVSAHRWLFAVGASFVIVGTVGTFTGNATPVKAASTCPDSTSICFGTPNVMDPMESVGEPTIVHSPASDNTVYASGPWGTGTQRSIWNASADLGETFRLVQQCPPTSGLISVPGACPAPDAVTGTANPPGGGDTDQRLDHTGKDYFADLWALACDRVAETPDHGATANQFFFGCNSPTTTNNGRPEGSDRQWLAEFDPHLSNPTANCMVAPDCATATSTPMTYMEYNNLQTTQNGCSYWVKSTDGLHYSPANNDVGNYGCDGYPSVDQVTGKVFEASGQGTDATGSHGCPANTLCVNIGTPIDSAGDLCFLDDSGSTTIGGATGATVTCPNGGGLITAASGLAGDPALLFTVSSMDSGRNLHITYAVNGSVSSSDNGVTGTSTYQVFTTVASSASGWTKWATPVQVSQSPSNVNVFPWMVAGGPGRSDSVWYGTNQFTDPSTNNSQAWNVYMSQVVWPTNPDGTVQADTGGKPLPPTSKTMVLVSPHPSHYDSICLAGTNCIMSQGDRNLADFFTVTIDHNGAAEVEYDDTSNGLIQPAFNPATQGGCVPPCGIGDHPGAPVVTIARQDQGPGLLGSSVTLRPNEPDETPTVGQYDPSGDGLYPVIGGANQPALDFVNDSTTNMANHLNLSGGNLTVTMKLNDLSSPSIMNVFNPTTGVPGTQFLQYVTRWVMCGTYSGGPGGNCKIFYAEAECQTLAGCSTGTYTFWAGQANSLDLCSVSACDPHVETYPDLPVDVNGNATAASMVSGGTVNQSTGVITIPVPVGDIGNPSATTLLEEVGSYAFASAQAQSQVSNPNAETDQLPLTVDGICCFNFLGNTGPGNGIPEAPWSPALIGLGAVAVVAGGVLRRRRSSNAIHS